MGLYFGENMEIRRGYIPNNICRIGLEDESRHEFKLGSNLSNIENKVREKEIIKEPCPILDLIERKILRYRYLR